MEELFIFGNGFDLAHDLKTKYSDFRKYLDTHNPDTKRFLDSLEESYHVKDDDTDRVQNWWRTFEYGLGDSFDFITEFEAQAECTISSMIDDEGEPMSDVESTLETYWKLFYEYIQNLNIWMLKWVSTIDLYRVAPKYKRLINNKKILFLTFNYTELLEDIYKIEEKNILHIHGSLSDGNVVIGHGNKAIITEYEEKANAAERELLFSYKTMYKAIAEFFKFTFKDTNTIIKQNVAFWEKLHLIKKVSVFGHSLGDVDLPYFKIVNESIDKYAEWFFYIHVDENNIYKEGYAEALKIIRKIGLKKGSYHINSDKRFLK